MQHLFFLWLERKYGFVYKTSLENFIYAGGWDILTEQEKKKFMDAFSMVSKHEYSRTPNILTEDRIRNEIKKINTNYLTDDEIYHYIDIINTEDLTGFVSSAATLIQKLKASKKNNWDIKMLGTIIDAYSGEAELKTVDKAILLGYLMFPIGVPKEG